MKVRLLRPSSRMPKSLGGGGEAVGEDEDEGGERESVMEKMKMKVGEVVEWRLTYMKMEMNVGKESVMGKMMMMWRRDDDEVLMWFNKMT